MKKFKKWFTPILIIGCVNISLAQVERHDLSEKHKPTAKNEYITDNNANKFLGTWEWKGNGDLLKINLKKIVKNWGSESSPQMFEAIYGGYEYVSNSVVLEKLSSNKFPISGGSEGQPNTVYLVFYNEHTKRRSEYILNYIDKFSVKFSLSNTVNEGFVKNDLSLPLDIILKKQD